MRFVTLLMFGPLLCSAVAVAAPVPDAGTLLREQQQAPQLPPRLPAPEEPSAERAPLTDSSIKVVIKEFIFSGITGMASEAELQELLKDAIGQEHGLADMQGLAARVTNFLRDKGFMLARAYLPKQDITNGILEIAVLGGKVDGSAVIRVKEGSRVRDGILQNMVNNGVKSGEALHGNQLERSLMLINDLPGVTAKGTLERGATYGSTKVLVDVEEGPLFSGGFTADNFGNRYTGTSRGTGFAVANDPFGIGDQFFVSMIGAEDFYQGRAGYTAQLLPNGLKGGFSFSSLYYKLGKEFEPLKYDGHADTYGANLSYPLLRSRTFSLWANAAYEYRILNDYADGVRIKDRDIHSGTVDLSSSSLDSWGGGGLTSIKVAATGGDTQLGNLDDAQNDSVTAKTAGSYAKFNYSLARLQRVVNSLAVFGSVNGQFAPQNLDSSEKFILGGPTGIRSYPVGEASGDEGHSFTGELRYDTPLPSKYGALQLIGFFDAGNITLNKNEWLNAITTATGQNNYWLYGSGLGLNYSKPGLFALRGSWAHTIDNNPGRSTTGTNADNLSEDNRFWLQATVWF